MNNASSWYHQLSKPSWAPPSWLFGPVWTFLYIIIIVSFGTVLYKIATGKIPWIVAIPIILNIIFNLAYSPIQFGLRNNFLAMIDSFLILGTLIWVMVAIYPYIKWAALVNIPYLGWVMFATVLQVTITVMNR